MRILCEYCHKSSNSLSLYKNSHCKSIVHIYNKGKYYEKYISNGSYTCAHISKFGNCKYGVKCNLQYLYNPDPVSKPVDEEVKTEINISQLLQISNKNIPVSLIPSEIISNHKRKLKYYFGKDIQELCKIHKRSKWE